MLSPFRMVCRDFILPEPASYVFFYALFNLRKLLYIIKTYCASHRIHEEVLDAAVQAYAQTVREQCAEEVEKLAQLQKMWALRKPILDAHILSLQKKVQELEREIDEIVIEKLKGSVSNPRPR